jgi:Flp pilus assembly protein TadB
MPPILRMRLQELRNQQGRIVQEKDKSKETTHTVKQELRSSAQIIEVRP